MARKYTKKANKNRDLPVVDKEDKILSPRFIVDFKFNDIETHLEGEDLLTLFHQIKRPGLVDNRAFLKVKSGDKEFEKVFYAKPLRMFFMTNTSKLVWAKYFEARVT